MKAIRAISPFTMNCPGRPMGYWNAFLLLLVLLLGKAPAAYSQMEDTYDEITIVLNIQRIGSIEIPAIIYKDEAYLPVKDIFDFLRIKSTLSRENDLLTGYFINPQSKFTINKTNNTIGYEGKLTQLEPTDLIKSGANLYLRSSYFGEIFGLDCKFNFRELSVTLTTKIELPVIREMQQELIRKNICRLRGEKKADTTITRNFPMFHIGMADWSVVSSQQTNIANNTRLNLSLGGVLAGGETNLYLNYTSGQPLTLKQQYYNWRFVNNDNPFLRQITVGKMFTKSSSSLFAPITGLQFSNIPTTYRRSYGTYTLSNKTEPGWIVELYINNVLVNFMKADASGFYTFEVPLVYGSSSLKLRFYGPWGEERTSEEYINIPFNFMPVDQFEYTLTGGVVQDDAKSRFARANLNYGLSRRITIGGGMEYLSTLVTGKLMPYVTASMRVGSHFLLSGERTYGVRSLGTVSYRTPANFQADLSYTKYDPGQTAVKYNYLEEKKFTVSMPVRGKHFSAFSRLTIDKVTLLKSQYTNAEMLISSVIRHVSTNLTTFAIITDRHPLVYSNLALSFRMPAGIRFTPQTQFEYRQKKFSLLRGEMEKSISSKGFFNISYEKNLLLKTQSINIGLRYNCSFAQSFFNVHQSGKTTSLIESARGSLVYDNQTGYLGTNNQINVGKGAVILVPFLDLNNNGEKDENEPRVAGLNIRVNGGRIEVNKKDSSIRIVGLEAYNDYLIEMDKNSFDNIAWQLKKPVMRVSIEPNYFKLVEVPVTVSGEVSGSVMLENGKELNGIGRIIVNIYNARSKPVAKILSEPDGYFSFSGLAPGKYTASVDADQLSKLKISGVTPTNIPFTIKASTEGDVEDGLQFVLKK